MSHTHHHTLGTKSGLLHSDGIVGIADMDCPVFRQISIVSRSSKHSIHAKCVFVDWAGDLFAVHLAKKIGSAGWFRGNDIRVQRPWHKMCNLNSSSQQPRKKNLMETTK